MVGLILSYSESNESFFENYRNRTILALERDVNILENVMTIERYGTPKSGGLPFAKATSADGWLYVSGQVPRDKKGQIVYGNMTTQSRVTLDNLKSVLELAGYTLNDVVRVGVWIDDPRDFSEFNKVYAEYFASNQPCRTTVEVNKLPTPIAIELKCIATIRE